MWVSRRLLILALRVPQKGSWFPCLSCLFTLERCIPKLLKSSKISWKSNKASVETPVHWLHRAAVQVLSDSLVERLPVNAVCLEDGFSCLFDIRVIVRVTHDKGRSDYPTFNECFHEKRSERLR